MKNDIIIVNENDVEIGSGEKLEVHLSGKLHRAFSVFIFNSKDELLLQRRALGKYHSGGLWTNTCCSHPKVGETTLSSAMNRLQEEMGFTCDISEIFSFTYQHKFENNICEDEYDHVFIGKYDLFPIPNPTEVMAWKWINIKYLQNDIIEHHDKYTFWFALLVDRVIDYYIDNYNKFN